MTCSNEFLSIRQIVGEYPGTGPETTWRSRVRRNTGGLRTICRKVGGSVRIARPDIERYLSNGLADVSPQAPA